MKNTILKTESDWTIIDESWKFLGLKGSNCLFFAINPLIFIKINFFSKKFFKKYYKSV